MKQTLRAGAELDILSGQEYKDGQTALIKALLNRSKKPSVRTLDQVQAAAVGSTAQLITASPPPGRAWEIRRLVVAVGTRTTATVTGVFVYRSTEAPGSLVDFDVTLPHVSTWEAEQFVIYPGDSLIVVVVGTAGATDVVGLSVQGIDYDTVTAPIDTTG